VGALISDYCGLNGIEAVRIEAASASGGAALHQGVMSVASGINECVIVTGVEQMTDVLQETVSYGVSLAVDTEYELAADICYLIKNEVKIPTEIPRLFKELSDRVHSYSEIGDIFPIKNKIEEINRAFPMKTKENQEIGTPIFQTIKESPLAQTIVVLSVAAFIGLVVAYYPISALLERKLEFVEILMVMTLSVAFGVAYLSQWKKH
jgi:acetyl-CoA C-acetyltransferase